MEETDYVSEDVADRLKTLKEMGKWSLEEKKALLIKSGIITKSGKLSSHYK